MKTSKKTLKALAIQLGAIEVKNCNIYTYENFIIDKVTELQKNNVIIAYCFNCCGNTGRIDKVGNNYYYYYC